MYNINKKIININYIKERIGVVLSPAKTLDFNKKNNDLPMTKPYFIKEARSLVEELKTYDIISLEKLMKISNKLAVLNKEKFQEWDESLDNAIQCSLAFKGEAYRGLDIGSYNVEDYFYANDHLRILSGLYGVLRPFDGINFYRLEMGTKLNFNEYKNLYEFWNDKIINRLYEELKSHKEKKIINLASNEYFKSIEKIGEFKDVQVINIAFKELKDYKYKIVTVKAKRARGLMSSFIIKNQIETIEEIKKFDVEGYEYNEELSSNSELVFTRDNNIFQID